MDSFEFNCPACHARLQAKQSDGGRLVVCPRCYRRMQVPIVTNSSQQEAAIPVYAAEVTQRYHDLDYGVTIRSRNNVLAIVSLVCSCLGFIVGPLTCVPGIVCGHIALYQCRKDPSQLGKGFAVAGLILGYIIVGAFVLFFLGIAALLLH
jgi:hypothetical protein